MDGTYGYRHLITFSIMSLGPPPVIMANPLDYLRTTIPPYVSLFRFILSVILCVCSSIMTFITSKCHYVNRKACTS